MFPHVHFWLLTKLNYTYLELMPVLSHAAAKTVQ